MLSLSFKFMLFIAICTAYDDFMYIDETYVEQAFTSFLLVPTVISVSPKDELSVQFSSEKVSLGNKIPAYSAYIPPYIYFEAEPESLYTLALLDADFCSAGAPIDAPRVHALMVNSPGNNIDQADYLTAYSPTIPYPGAGYHRYVILLFKQLAEIDITCPELRNLPTNRTNFSIKDFAYRYGLGDAIAGNFYLTQTIVCNQDEEVSRKCILS